MKLLRENKQLVEDTETELQKELDKVPEQDVLDLKDASVKEVAAAIQQAAAEDDEIEEPTAEEAVEEAAKVFKKAEFIENPYGTADPGQIKTVLQMALNASLKTKKEVEVGVSKGHGNFPNVLLIGLAGFGKTDIVRSFCEEHGINLFPCDAKTLDTATVGGIPYPVKDPVTKQWTQIPVASKYWEGLSRPNTVIFLDELNRAKNDIRGTLLGLINNHVLPISRELPDGKTTSEVRFKNILFTVMAINPADEQIFPGATGMDVAELNRAPYQAYVNPSKTEFLKYIDAIYSAIDKNNNLSIEDHEMYNGQWEIAKCLLNSSNFKFSDKDHFKAVARGQKYAPGEANYAGTQVITYRSLYQWLHDCDGTMNDFLAHVKVSGLGEDKYKMIQNCFLSANYSDNKAKQGNKSWNTTVNATRAQAAAQDIDAALDSFSAALGSGNIFGN